MKSVPIAIVLVGLFATSTWRYMQAPALDNGHKRVTAVMVLVLAIMFLISLAVPQ